MIPKSLRANRKGPLTIKELNENGYMTDVRHERAMDKLEIQKDMNFKDNIHTSTYKLVPRACSGTTYVVVYDPNSEGQSFLLGKSKCNDKDNYCRKFGVQKALARLAPRLAPVSQTLTEKEECVFYDMMKKILDRHKKLAALDAARNSALEIV
jgi:hypothetical protein